jgi:hypothetical protein
MTERAIIEYDSIKTEVSAIMNAIKNAGYQPEEISQKKSSGFFKKLFERN